MVVRNLSGGTHLWIDHQRETIGDSKQPRVITVAAPDKGSFELQVGKVWLARLDMLLVYIARMGCAGISDAACHYINLSRELWHAGKQPDVPRLEQARRSAAHPHLHGHGRHPYCTQRSVPQVSGEVEGVPLGSDHQNRSTSTCSPSPNTVFGVTSTSPLA